MKYKYTIILLILLGSLGMPSIISASASTLAMQQFDKSTMIKKKLSDAQKYISNEDYLAAQNTLNSLLKLDPNNSKAKELLEECELGIKKQKQRVYQAYQDACKDGTISALQNFISKYPNSEYVPNAKSRIEDYNLWQKAKEQNTITAYNSYLSQSSILAYKDDAKDAITTIQSEIEWNNCKASNDEDKLNSFIQTYSSSKFVSQAKYRLNILKGERFYATNDYTLAYSYLNEANNYQALTGAPAAHLKAINDYRLYESVISSSDVSKVKNYLNSLSSSSPYYEPTSNRLAILLGSALSMYSSDYSMDEALAYAKDDDTKATVKRYINKVKADKAYYEHQRKVLARKNWWKNRFMFGWNTFHFDYLDDIMSVGTGLRFRFGRWSDPVNLLFGAEYSYLMYLDGDADYYWEDNAVLTVAHSIEVPVGLRFNLFKTGRFSKFYIGCNAAFGFNVSEGSYFNVNKNTLAIEPQLGFASKSLDFGIYYKRYLKDKDLFEYTEKYNQRIGCFLTWFF